MAEIRAYKRLYAEPGTSPGLGGPFGAVLVGGG
jgi:hypothetical protein